jgi:nucleoside-diphosphate-sugar epimerase
MKVILFGGDGFLGRGLQDHFKQHNIDFKSIDIKDYDLIRLSNKHKCISDLEDVTHIVILASKIGKTLFETSAKSSGYYNTCLHNFMYDAIDEASTLYGKPYNVTYYSSSEVYGNLNSINDVITENSPFQFIENDDRYLYSMVKHKAENDYVRLHYNYPNIISSLKILYPFNIYGKNQKRGVVYEMIKSALKYNRIFFNKNTTRTMTGLKLASEMACSYILSDDDIYKNIADNRCSLTLKSLAHIIGDVLNINNIEYHECSEDNFIQYRHTSKPDEDIELSKSIMKDEIIELYEEIKNEI